MVRVPCNVCLKHLGKIGAAGIFIAAGYFLIFQTGSKLSKNVIPDAVLFPSLIRQVVGGIAILASVLMTTGGYHLMLTKIWIFLMTVAIGCMVVMEAIFYITPSIPLQKLWLGISMFGGFYTFVGYEADNKKIRVIGRLIFAFPLACGAAMDAWEMLGAQLHFDMKNLFLLFGIVAGVVSGMGLALGIKVHICAVFMCVYLLHEAMHHLVEMTKYQTLDADVTTDEFVSMWRCLVLTFIAIALYGHDSLMGEDQFVTGNWKSSSAKRVQPGKKSKFDTCISYFMKYFGLLLFAGMVGVGGYCLVFVPAGRAVLLPLPHIPAIFCQILGGVAIIGALLVLPGRRGLSICWVYPIGVIVLFMGLLQALIHASEVNMKGWDGMLMFLMKNGIVNISMLSGILMLAGYEWDYKRYRLFGRLAFAAPIVCQAGYFTYSMMQIDTRYDMDFAFRVLSQCTGVIGGILVAFGCKTHIGAFFLCGFLFHESMQYVVALLALQGGEHSHNLYTQLVSTKYMFAAEYLLLLGITMALFGYDQMHKEAVQTTEDAKIETALSTGLLSNSVMFSAY